MERNKLAVIRSMRAGEVRQDARTTAAAVA